MRRARIKAVANLSAASRRPAAKSSAESKDKNTESEEKPCDLNLATVSQANAPVDPSNIAEEASVSATASIQKSDDAISHTQHDIESKQSEPQILSEETATFKTPLQLPRKETELLESSGIQAKSSKFRRLKTAPRLNASRLSVAKAQDDGVAFTATAESLNEEATKPQLEEKVPAPHFTLPTKPRIEAPQDVVETPKFIVNQHVLHPGAPPSPFPYAHGHSRIRTDSLCSMKSNRDITVANLQPRKNIRTEDQKIIDIKRESRERLSNKDLDKSQLRMFDMIYFNPQANPMKPRSPNISGEKVKKNELVEEPPQAAPLSAAAAVPVPQLRLNANGEMVLDETSLVIESEQQKQNRNALATSNVVYDDDLSGNYGYYKRQQRTKEWPHEETVKFYRCLNTVGTDFSLMLNLFPNRSRRDLKLKFKKEEKHNPQLIDKALLKHNTFDLDELKKDLDQEEEERRKEAQSKSNSEVKELVKRKILKKQETKLKAQNKTKIEKMLTDGEAVFNMVDNVSPQEVKENWDVSSSFAVANTAVPKKRLKKTKAEDGATSVMAIYATEAPVKPVKRPRPSKKTSAGDESASLEPLAKKPRQYRKKNAVKLETDSVPQETSMIAIKAKADSPTLVESVRTFEASRNVEVSVITVPENPFENDSIPIEVTTSDTVPMDVITTDTVQIVVENMEVAGVTNEVSDAQNHEPIATQPDDQIEIPQDNHPETENVSVSVPSPIVQASEPTESREIDAAGDTSSVPEAPSSANEETFLESVDAESQTPITKAPQNAEPLIPVKSETVNIPVPEKKAEKKPQKAKSRRGKHKPTLVNRLKLDANGEMVLDDSTATTKDPVTKDTQEVAAIEVPAVQEQVEIERPVEVELFSPISSQVFEQPSLQLENESTQEHGYVDENLNETSVQKCDDNNSIQTPSSSTISVEEFGDAFVNNLDLEKLVLVQAQRDGKDVFEIHEIDPITQEICDVPLDLPPRYFDLIVSIMTGVEEEEDDE